MYYGSSLNTYNDTFIRYGFSMHSRNITTLLYIMAFLCIQGEFKNVSFLPFLHRMAIELKKKKRIRNSFMVY